MTDAAKTAAAVLRQHGYEILVRDGEVWLDTDVAEFDGICVGAAGFDAEGELASDNAVALADAEKTLTAAVEVVRSLRADPSLMREGQP